MNTAWSNFWTPLANKVPENSLLAILPVINSRQPAAFVEPLDREGQVQTYTMYLTLSYVRHHAVRSRTVAYLYLIQHRLPHHRTLRYTDFARTEEQNNRVPPSDATPFDPGHICITCSHRCASPANADQAFFFLDPCGLKLHVDKWPSLTPRRRFGLCEFSLLEIEEDME